jgi:hypothetical protein
MPRSVAAYLVDILEACEAIEDVLSGVDLPSYLEQRSIRSSVEREFIIIGEAVTGIRHTDLNSRSASRMLASSSALGTYSRTTMPRWMMKRCTG